MSHFHFSLEPLLRLRRLLEEQQFLVLERAQQQVNCSQQKITAAMQQLRSAQTAWLAQMTAGANGAELHFARLCEHNRCKAIEHQKLIHQELMAEAIAARESYLRLRRESEVVQHLRDRACEKWRVEQSRREQQQIDELFLMRHPRRAPFALPGQTSSAEASLPN